MKAWLYICSSKYPVLLFSIHALHITHLPILNSQNTTHSRQYAFRNGMYVLASLPNRMRPALTLTSGYQPYSQQEAQEEGRRGG